MRRIRLSENGPDITGKDSTIARKKSGSAETGGYSTVVGTAPDGTTVVDAGETPTQGRETDGVWVDPRGCTSVSVRGEPRQTNAGQMESHVIHATGQGDARPPFQAPRTLPQR